MSANCPQDPGVWQRASLAAHAKADADNELKRAAKRNSDGTGRANLRTPRAVELDVIRRYNENQPGSEIAKAHGIQHGTIYKILRRNGIEPRTKSEAMRLSRAKQREQGAA
jgi:DNA invertase Pin-like site-specific DNA recombinase